MPFTCHPPSNPVEHRVPDIEMLTLAEGQLPNVVADEVVAHIVGGQFAVRPAIILILPRVTAADAYAALAATIHFLGNRYRPKKRKHRC